MSFAESIWREFLLNKYEGNHKKLRHRERSLLEVPLVKRMQWRIDPSMWDLVTDAV